MERDQNGNKDRQRTKLLTCYVIAISAVEALAGLRTVQPVASRLAPICADVADPSWRAFAKFRELIANSSVLAATRRVTLFAFAACATFLAAKRKLS